MFRRELLQLPFVSLLPSIGILTTPKDRLTTWCASDAMWERYPWLRKVRVGEKVCWNTAGPKSQSRHTGVVVAIKNRSFVIRKDV